MRCHLLPFVANSEAISGQSAARMLPKSCQMLPFAAISTDTLREFKMMNNKEKKSYSRSRLGKHAFFQARSAARL
jgi:hypothetical protein